MALLDETFAVSWRAIRSLHARTLTWDQEDFICGMPPVDTMVTLADTGGGVVREADASCFVMREDFIEGPPGEGDNVTIAGAHYEIAHVQQIKNFALIYTLVSMDSPP